MTMLHAVTLGSIDFIKPDKRHPTIVNVVLIDTSVIILGDIPVKQHNKIGASAIITRIDPPYVVLVSPKAVRVKNLAPMKISM